MAPAMALMQKAWVLLFTGQFDAAAQTLVTALEVDPPPTELLQVCPLSSVMCHRI
jgi:hypothetical protein